MKHILAIITLLIFCCSYPAEGKLNNNKDKSYGLSKRDVILIHEANYLQSKLGPKIWPGWNGAKSPILYKTKGIEYLINHPKPPADYAKYFDQVWGDTLLAKASKDTTEYRAAYAIEGYQTVVVSPPGDDENPCHWVITFAHELFHVYQGTNRIVNPFTGKYSDKHELSFPYDFGNKELLAANRVEAELLYNLSVKTDFNAGDSIASKKVFDCMTRIYKKLYSDSLQYKYKLWMEWLEGAAKYTEYRLADLAGGRHSLDKYTPLEEFANEFPGFNYLDLWEKDYKNQIFPIRFVGEGVKNRMMFYYSGMAKALILDRVNSNWKKHYFRKTLDELLNGK